MSNNNPLDKQLTAILLQYRAELKQGLNELAGHDPLEQGVAAVVRLIQDAQREARIDERNEVALDNYRGHTFSDSTNYEAKFAKFIDNNEKRIATLNSNLSKNVHKPLAKKKSRKIPHNRGEDNQESEKP